MKGTKLKRVVAGVAVAAALAGASGAQEPGTDNQAQRLEPIVVTATRIEQKVSEQASDVSVVTRDTVERKAPVLAGDVLKGLPGLDVQRSGGPGNRENIKIRGSLAAHTLVMIDGFPVNSPTLGQFDIGSLPVDDFERIEVVRGAQSALYGSNAIGGVVNFIPRKGEEGRQYGVGALGGSHDSLKWNGFAQGAGKRGNLHLGLGGFESDGFLPNDDSSLVSFLGAGEAPIGSRSRLHAVAFSTDMRKGIPVDFGMPGDVNHELTRRGFMSGARWEWDVTKIVTVSASGMIFDEFFHEKDPADPGELFPYEFDDLTKTRKTDARLEARLALLPGAVVFIGGEYLKDRATDALRSNFGDSELAASTINRSVFAQGEFRLGKGTGLSVGGRLDRNAEAGTEKNPKLAAYHEFGDSGVRVRGAFGRGFRVATISEKRDPTVGNPGLLPESANSYEAGADLSLARKRATLSGTWFYQAFRNLIQFDSSVPGPVGFGQLRNLGRAFSRGAEAAVTYIPLPQVETSVSYTYSETWDSTNRKRLLGIPRHRGTASLLVFPVPALQTQVDWRVESDQRDSPLFSGKSRRPGFAVVDAFARYKWEPKGADVREIALTGKILNLLNRRYEERLDSPAPGINFLVGAEARI